MPFDRNTKARMFIRSARICCLCYKQCGVNIEAAHIIDEHKGGSDTDDNGIPVCFDCHQEIGSYDPQHPKGNKFSPQELKARRDKVYELVESGFLQAQIITSRIHNTEAKSGLTISSSKEVYRPSKEVKEVLSMAKSFDKPIESLPLKLDLLSEQDQAYLIDRLVDEIEEGNALYALMGILSSKKLKHHNLIILEQILRKVTLTTNIDMKRDFINSVPVEILLLTDEGLRMAFFTEIITILETNQFIDLNKIAPSVSKVQTTIAEGLLNRYIKVMLELAKSDAWYSKPSAEKLLMDLPDNLAILGIKIFDKNYIFWHREDFYKEFALQYKHLWSSNNKDLLLDFTSLDEIEFFKKWSPYKLDY